MLNWLRNLFGLDKKSVLAPLETPIVIIIFKRPDHATRLIDSLRPLRPKELFIVADGPRPGSKNDAEMCEQARQAVIRGIDWPANVRTDFSAENLGCRKRVSSGLDWVFSQVEEAIVLEDDLVPHLDFFPFCTELLQHYRDEPKIGAISGNCFQPAGFDRAANYYFSVYPHCWGWATWRRAWATYDHDLLSWQTVRESGALEAWFGNTAEAAKWTKTIDQVADGTLDSWATIWTYSVARANMLTALPTRNLVSNLGFDDAGTHTVNARSPLAQLPTFDLTFPLVHPERIERDLAADAHTRHEIYRIPRD